MSDVSNNKSGQRLNGALVVAYVIITVDHMALDLFYVTAQARHSDMFQMDWPSDGVECDQLNHTVAEKTNLSPAITRKKEAEHGPRGYTIVYRYAQHQ